MQAEGVHSGPTILALAASATLSPQVGPPRPQSPMPASHVRSQRRQRALSSDDAVRLSWVQSAMTLVAYVWLLSNFARTEFALNDLDTHVTVEPDVYVSFGPYAYVGNAFFRNEVGGDRDLVSSAKPVALWGYKFDTTSIAMRAYAEHLGVSAFPDCVLYHGKCDGDFLPPAVVMTMLDSLVDAIQNATTPHSTPSASALLATQDPYRLRYRPRALVLRVGYEYFDRIHHYLFPQVFANPFWRACQAVYYSPELLAMASESISAGRPQENRTIADLCSLAYDEVRPYFCDERWTNFRHSCARDNKKCRAVGRVSQHAVRRLSALRKAYPNATVDLLVIESVKDIAIQRGGITFVGKGGTDIVTLFRIRTCATDGSCETLMLDDYRYEGETIISDVVKWNAIVTTLRGAAQVYYWIRVFTLFCGCYFAAAAQASTATPRSVRSTLRRAFAMFFKIPNQCIVYGSAFPLVCYLLAHVIDSPIVYEIMAQRFESFNGLFEMSVPQLITFSSIQMRNVWLLGNMAHLSVRLATRGNWSPTDGVWGVPQFSIALVSSLTIISQFRFLSLRQTPAETILPLKVMSPIHPVIDTLLYVNGGGGKAGLGGIFLDIKAMMCSAAILAFVGAVLTLVLRFALTKSRIRLVFWRSYSATPLSAGVIWPTTALAVSWSDDLFQIDKLDIAAWRQVQTLRASRSKAKGLVKPQSTKSAAVAPFEQQQKQPEQPKQLPSRPMEITSLDDRSDVVESAMYLMNIAMLSDPTAYLFWRWNMSKHLVGYFRSSNTQRVYLIPLVHTTSNQCGLNWSELTLERIVFADELPWSEIITCG